MSIKSYALSFILLYILIFSLSSTIAFLDIKKLNKDITQANLNSAKAELVDAINKLVNNHQAITDKFSVWDEVRQQLDSPDYYSYWQTHRLLNSGMLPDYFTEAAIYDTNGHILEKVSIVTLPDTIRPGSTKAYFNIVDKTAL